MSPKDSRIKIYRLKDEHKRRERALSASKASLTGLKNILVEEYGIDKAYKLATRALLVPGNASFKESIKGLYNLILDEWYKSQPIGLDICVHGSGYPCEHCERAKQAEKEFPALAKHVLEATDDEHEA